jgi:hypothetical protein
MYRTAPVSAALMILGTLNLCVFLAAGAASQRRPDFEGLPVFLLALGFLLFSACLYLAGVVCVGAALKSKRHVFRSVAGMIAGGSALIWWLIGHVLARIL